MNLKDIWIIEIHNSEEYEDYHWESLIAFNTYKEAEEFIFKHGYIKIDNVACLNGVYVCENWIHNKMLLEEFDKIDEFYSGYLTINKLPIWVGE